MFLMFANVRTTSTDVLSLILAGTGENKGRVHEKITF